MKIIGLDGVLGVFASSIAIALTPADGTQSIVPDETIVTVQNRCGEIITGLTYRNTRRQGDDVSARNEIIALSIDGNLVDFANTASPVPLETSGWVTDVAPTCAYNDATSFALRIDANGEQRGRFITVFAERYLISDAN